MKTLPLLLSLLAACDPSGPRSEGWAVSKKTGGPEVLWDTQATPLPEIPLPNDAATRLDPTSPTGRRINVSVEAGKTVYEQEIRAEFNRMDGFGTYAPIFASFDAPLDLDNLVERHWGNDDFRDDAVFLLNVDPSCARFGEEVATDVGGRRTPVTFYGRSRRTPDPEAPGGYRLSLGGNPLFVFDNQGDSRSVHYEQWNEDANGNGVLDPGEDHDLDGVLDVANFVDPAACDDLDPAEDALAYDACVAENLLSWYDRTSNTLILRPLWPLEERCTHAVVLTDRLVGEDGKAVQSPFSSVNVRDQTADLQQATDLLSRYGLALDNVAFAWTFTTGSMTDALWAAREGLHGRGPFARWQEEYPASSLRFWTRQELSESIDLDADPAVADDRFLPGSCVAPAFTWFWDEAQGEWEPNMCAIGADMSSISMLAFGTFEAPDLLVDKDGVATEEYAHDQDERWDLDPQAGTVTAGTAEIPVWCALPHEREDVSCSEGNPEGQPWCKPFPVALYLHGYGSNRNEVSLHMGRHTGMGQAVCAMDMPGHGLRRWGVDPEAAAALFLAAGTLSGYGVPELRAILIQGRDRDLNNDGLPDSGADQWTADVFHTRDMVRQEVLEHMQLVRILKSIDGERVASDGTILGDVDGDGEPDLGGIDNAVSAWGVSLGGIVSGVLAGAEPALDAVSPNAGGAGLTNISTRSTQGGVPDAVLGPMIGPFVAGCLPVDGHQRPLDAGAEGDDCTDGRGQAEGPWAGGELRLFQLAHDAPKMRLWEMGSIDGVAAGDRIRLENLVNGDAKETVINERGWFRLSVGADALDAIEKRVALGMADGVRAATVEDPTSIGDALRLTILDGDSGEVKHTVETFLGDVTFQGITYPAGAPLVALQRGLGYDRNTPDIRRFTAIAQHAISPADPGVWAPYIAAAPRQTDDPLARDGGARTLLMTTAGDTTVPANTGVDHARAAGLLGSWARDESLPAEHGWRELFVPDERYGMSKERWLVETWAVEGDADLERFPDNDLVQAVIFDIEDQGDGATLFSCGDSDWSAIIGENNCPDELDGQEVFFGVPNAGAGRALRSDQPRGDGTLDAFRIPLLRPGGQHGIYNAQSFRVFDNDAYAVNFTLRFLISGGADAGHKADCDCSASAPPTFLLDGAPEYPIFDDRDCTTDDLKVCDAACAADWGIWTPPEVDCQP